MCFGLSRLSPATGTAGIFSFLSNSVYMKLTTLGDPMMNQEMALSSQVGRGSCMRSALSIQPCESFPHVQTQLHTLPSGWAGSRGGRAAAPASPWHLCLLEAPEPFGMCKGVPGEWSWSWGDSKLRKPVCLLDFPWRVVHSPLATQGGSPGLSLWEENEGNNFPLQSCEPI